MSLPLTNEVRFGGSVTCVATPVAVAGPLFVTVTVNFKSAPTCAGLGETDCATARSASVGLTTFRAACAVCESWPLAALRLRVLLPVDVLEEVETVSVEDCGFASVMLTEAGWNPEAAFERSEG